MSDNGFTTSWLMGNYRNTPLGDPLKAPKPPSGSGWLFVLLILVAIGIVGGALARGCGGTP